MARKIASTRRVSPRRPRPRSSSPSSTVQRSINDAVTPELDDGFTTAKSGDEIELKHSAACGLLLLMSQSKNKKSGEQICKEKEPLKKDEVDRNVEKVEEEKVEVKNTSPQRKTMRNRSPRKLPFKKRRNRDLTHCSPQKIDRADPVENTKTDTTPQIEKEREENLRIDDVVADSAKASVETIEHRDEIIEKVNATKNNHSPNSTIIENCVSSILKPVTPSPQKSVVKSRRKRSPRNIFKSIQNSIEPLTNLESEQYLKNDSVSQSVHLEVSTKLSATAETEEEELPNLEITPESIPCIFTNLDPSADNDEVEMDIEVVRVKIENGEVVKLSKGEEYDQINDYVEEVTLQLEEDDEVVTPIVLLEKGNEIENNNAGHYYLEENKNGSDSSDNDGENSNLADDNIDNVNDNNDADYNVEDERGNTPVPTTRSTNDDTGDPLQCLVCDRVFKNAMILSAHLKRHAGKHPYQCDFCDTKCGSMGQLKNHLVGHTGEKPYSCRECGKCFKQRTGLMYHLRFHSGAKPYKCDVCEKSYTRNNILEQHKRMHHGDNRCQECGKSFSNFYNYKTHVRKHSHAKYQCDHCGRTFKDHSNFSKHLQLHVQVYKCGACHQNYKTRAAMELHACSDDKCFQCQKCEMKFIDYSSFDKHGREHRNREGSYICIECGKVSATKNTHTLHMRLHTGERPYPCAFCGKGFVSASHRKRHERQHTGEKPHACQACQKRFFRRDELNIHFKIHSVEKTTCELCGERFLDSHERSIHKATKQHICKLVKQFIEKNSVLKKVPIAKGEV